MQGAVLLEVEETHGLGLVRSTVERRLRRLLDAVR